LLSFVESAPRAYWLKVGNADLFRNSTEPGTSPSGNRCGPNLTGDQRGSIIMATILSLIYRHFLTAAIIGMAATQGVRR